MFKEIREEGKEQWKIESKIRLIKIISKKIETTMIGALASIEDNFVDYTEDLEFQKTYEKVRQEILDKGNQQIRNIKSEMENYDVEWLRYKLTLPFRKLKEQPNEESD